MKDVEDLEAQALKQESYDEWLTESWLLDEIERTPDQEERLLRLYDYLLMLKDYDDELKEND